jgi:hypothetical protein
VDIVERLLGEHSESMRSEFVEDRPSTGSGRISSSPGGGTSADVGSRLVAGEELTLEGVLAADAWARVRARELVGRQEYAR